MTPEIKQFISENFSNKKDFIIKFYTEEIPFFYKNFRQSKGHNPSPNLLKALFLFPFSDLEEFNYNEYINTQYFSPSRPSIFELDEKCFLGLAPCEGISLISPLISFGVDGCGGDFFTNFSSIDDTIYHTWEDYEGLRTINETLSSFIQKSAPKMRELYQLLTQIFKVDINCFTYSNNTSQYDFDNLNTSEDIPNIALQIYCDSYGNEVELTYSYDYFEHFFNAPDSDYFKFDSAVSILNSKLTSALYCLYFARKKKKLKKLVQTTSLAKGQNLNFIRNHFNKIIDSKLDKSSNFYITKEKFILNKEKL